MPARLANLVLLFASALACVTLPAATATATAAATPDGSPCTPWSEQRTVPPVERDRDPENVELDERTILSPLLFTSERPVQAGEQLLCVLTIRNRRSGPTTYELVARGMLGSRSARTPVRWLDADDPDAAATAASWLEPTPSSIRLEPRGVARVPVLVTVPESPPTGSVAAAIEVAPTEAEIDAGDTAVGIVTAVAVPVLLTVGEPGTPELSLHDVRAPKLRWERDPWTLRADLDNDGTAHATPRGRVRLRSLFGNTVANLAIAHPPLLVGGRQPLEVTWQDVPWFGIYRYDVRVAPAELEHADEVTRAEGWFVALPPWWVLAIAAAIIVLWVASRFRRHDDADDDDWSAAEDEADVSVSHD